MRVLYVDLEREWRGGQSQALLTLRGLGERGYAVELLAARIRRLRIVCWKLGSRFIKLRILACVPGLLVQCAV